MALIRRVHKFFIPGTYWSNEVVFRKARIFVNTCLVTTLFALTYLLVASLIGMKHSVWMLIASAIIFLACPVMLRGGVKFSICTNLFIGMACISTFWHATYDGGLTSGVLPWICITPVTAMIFNNTKNGWFWAITSIIGVSVLGALQISHVAFIREMNPKMLHIFITSCYTGLTFIIFLFALISETAYTDSLRKLDEKNQEIQWEKALAEQERKRAEQSEKIKQQFLANMSHEIRTPMNAIVGLTNILLEKNPSPEQFNHLKIIQKNSETLQSIINDVLDLSKIEAGKIELEHTDFDLKELIDITRQTFELKAKESGLALNVVYDNTIPAQLNGDPTRLSQVLINLVSNALKFTHNGGVTLKVEKGKGDSIHFSVSDTGIGMTPEQLKLVFEPFRQADAGTTRKYGGTGLGLYIAKQLVNIHNTELLVESIPGKGSTFSFSIHYSGSTRANGKKSDSAVTDGMLKEMAGLKVLLAEDNEFNRIVATETLELKIPGVVIDIAMNGGEAVEKAPGHDLVLMDVHMPEMDGYEATKKIRTGLQPPYNNIPIIALTASVIESDHIKCIRAGMNAVISKPFSIDKLLFSIYNVLNHGSVSTDAEFDRLNQPLRESERITSIDTLLLFCEDDMERVKKYISLYLEETPKNILSIKKSLKEGDFKNLKLVAHTLKTHLKYMGMKTATKVAADFEKICDGSQDTEILNRLFQEIEKMCNVSYSELKEYI